MARRRYQQGSIRCEGTRRPKWVLVYREDVVQSDGTLARPQRKVELGFLDEVPTKRLARRKADQVLRMAGINEMDYRPGRVDDARHLRARADPSASRRDGEGRQHSVPRCDRVRRELVAGSVDGWSGREDLKLLPRAGTR